MTFIWRFRRLEAIAKRYKYIIMVALLILPIHYCHRDLFRSWSGVSSLSRSCGNVTRIKYLGHVVFFHVHHVGH